VEGYVYRYHHKLFPVVDQDRLVRCVTTRQIKESPREEWDRQSVGAIAEPCSDDNTVAPDEDAMKALARMSRGVNSRLMVVEDGRLLGILALKDLLQFFRLELELDDLEQPRNRLGRLPAGAGLRLPGNGRAPTQRGVGWAVAGGIRCTVRR
jgi:hypothetical protein